MSFLGDLFDPAGAIATGGNNNTFESIFNPGENLIGNNGLGLEPSGWSNFNNNVGSTVDNFADNVGNANIDELKNLGKHFSSNPTQLFYSGADPASTSIWNKITNQKNTPFLDQWGGETSHDMQQSANHGINMEDQGYMSALAHMISSYEAGGALGNLGSGAYSAAFPATEAGAGSSALSDAVGATSGGGYGSSQTVADASQIPKWAAGANAATAGKTFNGAAQGTAGSLDNSQSPLKGGLYGGAAGGLSSINFAGDMGVTDPIYKGAINGAITGGARTGMTDSSNTGYGALLGMLQGAFKGGSGGPSPGGYSYGGAPSSDSGNGGLGGMGNIAATLGQMYLTHRANSGIQSQISNLNGLYAPNSPYAQQMQQTLDRQDAAGGRRSQYGTRAVELQAALANAASRNAPTLSNLYGQQRQNNFSGAAGMFAGARNAGLFTGLNGMFGQQQQPPMQSYSPVSSGPQDFSQLNQGQMTSDVNDTLPGYFGG